MNLDLTSNEISSYKCGFSYHHSYNNKSVGKTLNVAINPRKKTPEEYRMDWTPCRFSASLASIS